MTCEVETALQLNTQTLLFDQSLPVQALESHPHAARDLHDQGWTLVRGVCGIDAALAKASSILGSLNEERLACHKGVLRRLQLAKADKLPCREPDIQESFQALHHDMGLPLVSRHVQVGYLFSMLYAPMGGTRGNAETRIVPVANLLRQRKRHSRTVCDLLLHDYADRFGDGWTEPERHSSGRLGCLARVVDAMLEQPELLSFFDQGTWEWFRDDYASTDGRAELARETAWWAKHGYRLEQAETRITLRPGDMLMFDNVRCAHGRIGPRAPEEIWQVMWGVPRLSRAEIASIRGYFSTALAGD